MAHRISRRTLLTRSAQLAGAAAVAGIGGGALAGCGSGGSAVQNRPTQPSGPPRKGGHLRVGMWSEQAGLNPLLDTFTAVGSSYAAAVYDSLFTVGADGEIIPGLARSLRHSADYTTWTVGLREGVSYHDGTALDARTVSAQMEAALASPTFAASLANVAGVRMVDPVTVELTARTPWVPFDRYLTGTFGMMVSEATWKGESEKPVGTGPFLVEEWQNGSQFVAVRNPNYWRADRPHLDKVTFRPILNSTQRENSVKAGDLDIGATGSVISNLQALREDAGLLYYDDAGIDVIQPHHVFWQLNCMAPPLDDVRIRKALALALDQQKYYQTVFRQASSAAGWEGYQPVTSFFHPRSPLWSETGYPSAPDVEQATRLVAEYTAEKGRPRILVTATTEPTQQLALSLCKQMWEPLGMDVEVQQIDVGRLIANLIRGEFQATLVDSFAATDPDQNYIYWSPTTVAPIGQVGLNFAHNTNPEIEPLLQIGRQNPDPEARREAYQKVDQILNGQDFPYIYMGRSIGAAFTRPTVGGMGGATNADGQEILFAPGIINSSAMWLA